VHIELNVIWGHTKFTPVLKFCLNSVIIEWLYCMWCIECCV